VHTSAERARRRNLFFSFSSAVLLAAALSAGAETAPAAAGRPSLNSLPEAPQPQTRAQTDSPTQASDSVTLRATPRNILGDQAAIWTSPFRMRGHDLIWVAPLVLATGAAIATDHRTLRDVVSIDPSFNNSNTNASNVLIGGFIAAPVVLYGVGHFHANERARETGILGAEALVDGVVVEQGMKLIFWRERPYQDSERGRFFQSSAGIDSSFPSSHSVLAWSTAAVIAAEYHNPWTRIFVYSAATSVSLTRLMGQQHFPSDILVGSAAGWLVGHYVYKHRHRYEVARR
jgi:membrane-associated phospholipid phosphatase